MSFENHLLTWSLRRWIKPISLRDQNVADARRLTGRVPFGAKLSPGWRLRADQESALTGEWIEPTGLDHPARLRCILYLHGGGYIAMSARTHRSVTSRLAILGHASVFGLDYRLAPEYPFPAALEDALGAYRALIATGISASRIAVTGDSAGGGLALALLVALRDAKDPLPAAAVLFSPWTDLAATGNSIVDNDKTDAICFGAWVGRQGRHYLGDTPATDPRASPLYADLTGLPPLLIQVSSSEVLLDDSRRVADRAQQVGVETILQVWPNLPHGWQVFAPILPEARDALHEAGAFIHARLAPVA
jgi:epsilon-lactone hydrolase